MIRRERQKAQIREEGDELVAVEISGLVQIQVLGTWATIGFLSRILLDISFTDSGLAKRMTLWSFPKPSHMEPSSS